MTDTNEHQEAQDTPSAEPEPNPAEVVEVAPSIASLMGLIRAAVAPGAKAEAREAGAAACRSMLTVLEAKPGQPLAAALPTANKPAAPLAALISQPGLLNKLAAMSREQLLDLLKQVTGSLPVRTPPPTSAGPRFHLIQIPPVRGRGGGS